MERESQVQKLFLDLQNERNLKEQFLRERNSLLKKVEELQNELSAEKAESEIWRRKLHKAMKGDETE